LAGVEAHLRAVYAARPQAQRLKQAIEVGDRPAADERERAGELALDLGQRASEPGRDDHVGWPRGQIDERAVNVEKESEPLAVKSRHLIHSRAGKGRRAQRIHSRLLTPLAAPKQNFGQ
jgi:hypothetical protein